MTTIDTKNLNSTSTDKTVIDEVSGWLRLFDDGTVDRTWTGPPEALFLMSSIPPSPTPNADNVTVHDLPGKPNLRLYLPAGTLLPILLHFHGGGFCISHNSWYMYHQFYSRLAGAIPAAIFSVELSLAPEHRLPAQIYDSFSALLRLRLISKNQNSDPLFSSLDFSRVLLIGDSSGGNLVHEVAALAGNETDEFWSPVKLAGAIPIHPGFVRATRSKSELEMKQDPFLTLDMLDKFLALGFAGRGNQGPPYTCPMGTAAPAMENLRLPPFMVCVADKDLIRDTNYEYCEAMKKAGKKVKELVSEGMSHSFYLNKMAVDSDPVTAQRTKELIHAIKDFVSCP
ncbi:probable carboxylesterase 15 [Dioscorea cayenensis subsp. rotundata]|uniref:Probable carboxylesterase 15 n=1 Tax=Dioscorea cayennensis subsp. rotundata TaxID=55577 RepID=A0AB40BMT2_DIOCR|nr:probable carboxylesterase 15 [Dioscorea cayenensis subsp. rotundata]